MILYKNLKLKAAFRRFVFEIFNSLKLFELIEKIPILKIKEPWNRLYKRNKI